MKERLGKKQLEPATHVCAPPLYRLRYHNGLSTETCWTCACGLEDDGFRFTAIRL